MLTVGTLPSTITATVTNGSGTIAVVLSGAGSESDYDTALRAITFANASATPDTTQRVIDVNFSNAKLTSATGGQPYRHQPCARREPRQRGDAGGLCEDGVGPGERHRCGRRSADRGPRRVRSMVRSSVNSDGTLTYTPDADYNGSDTIAYSVTDGRGGHRQFDRGDDRDPAGRSAGGTICPARNRAPRIPPSSSPAANGNAVTVSDADGGSQTVTIAVAHGTRDAGRHQWPDLLQRRRHRRSDDDLHGYGRRDQHRRWTA